MNKCNLKLFSFLVLAGCNRWGHFPGQVLDWDETLWDASSVTAAGDGLYAILPKSGRLMYVAQSGEHNEVDLEGAQPIRLIATPDGTSLLAFAQTPHCEEEDRGIDTIDDCDADKLWWEYDLRQVDSGKQQSAFSLPGYLNAIAFSEDSHYAVAYLNYSQADGIVNDGIIALTDVHFIDLQTGTTQSLSVGFSPDTFLFDSVSNRAVILSRSEAVLVDLGTFERIVDYPLTDNPDDAVVPVGASLTPDGEWALITAQGKSDLYKLNLNDVSIDITNLSGQPGGMWVDPVADRTAVVYPTIRQVDLIDHDLFNTESEALEQPCNRIAGHDGMAVLYDDTGAHSDVYRLDMQTGDLVEYVLGNPLQSLQLTADADFAVAVLQPENGGGGAGLDGFQDANWGLGIIDLLDDASSDLVTSSRPVGVALVEQDGVDYALVLLEGLDELLQIDLRASSVPNRIELPASPAGIGAMPDGTFYITHNSALGLVSFLDPATGNLTSAGGFALNGIFHEFDLAEEK